MGRRGAAREVVAWVFAGVAIVALLAAILLSLSAQAQLTHRIQQERARNIRDGCQAQNARHDKTIAQLDLLIAQAPPDRKVRAESGRAGTVLLIDALAPKQNCDALVRSHVDTGR